MTDDEGIVAGALRLDRRESSAAQRTSVIAVEVPIRREMPDFHRDAGRGRSAQPIAQAVDIGCLLGGIDEALIPDAHGSEGRRVTNPDVPWWDRSFCAPR